MTTTKTDLIKDPAMWGIMLVMGETMRRNVMRTSMEGVPKESRNIPPMAREIAPTRREPWARREETKQLTTRVAIFNMIVASTRREGIPV
jgi:hypothetical protein